LHSGSGGARERRWRTGEGRWAISLPPDEPLAIFGLGVSDGVCGDRDRQIDVHVLSSALEPSLAGARTQPSAQGSLSRPGGLIPVDGHGKVRGAERVYAAGDATGFAIKHGGIGAPQADVAAQAIAALAGVTPEPSSCHPMIYGMLLTGGKPLYLSAQGTGGHGSSCQLSGTPTWSPPAKIAAKYLAPYLHEFDVAAGGAR
jgi:hypothetical protein